MSAVVLDRPLHGPIATFLHWRRYFQQHAGQRDWPDLLGTWPAPLWIWDLEELVDAWLAEGRSVKAKFDANRPGGPRPGMQA